MAVWETAFGNAPTDPLTGAAFSVTGKGDTIEIAPADLRYDGEPSACMRSARRTPVSPATVYLTFFWSVGAPTGSQEYNTGVDQADHGQSEERAVWK